ncbi:MAG: Rieske 2Fe-2S domain-containing protein [Chloroflexi bacterium]|nr:Rieske 2Fe-2S domain-containing protein [Chloroflexota bacterium]
MVETVIERVVEQQAWTDQLAGKLQGPIFDFLEQRAELRSLAHGTWLGHPLHIALTDVPVGSWTVTALLDLLDLFGLSRARGAADAALGIGLAGAVPTALTGLADWSHTDGPARRVGFIHGLTNATVFLLNAASLLARARGNRKQGIVLSSLGFGLLTFSTWLGGELVYRLGIGVSHTAFQTAPREFIPVLADAELGERQLQRVEVDGTPVLLTRLSGQVHAIGETCTHLGGPLAQGELEGDCVVCPWHGSKFRLTDGQVVAGPATVSERRYEVRIRNGRIEVRAAE